MWAAGAGGKGQSPQGSKKAEDLTLRQSGSPFVTAMDLFSAAKNDIGAASLPIALTASANVTVAYRRRARCECDLLRGACRWNDHHERGTAVPRFRSEALRPC